MRPAHLLLVLALAWTAPCVAAEPSIADVERDVVRRVNSVRGDEMRPPLRVDADLSRVAREYSCALLDRGTLSHTDAEGKDVASRVRAAGREYRLGGVNLAYNPGANDTALTAMRGWMRSPGHRDNILRPDFTDTGVGVCRDGETYYFTQIFSRR
jgi:uncharacterized protein YkwD